MGAEKRLQKVLDKANKNTGNTTEATDNREEISDALVSSGKGRLVRKGKKLYDKMNKGTGIKMVSPLDFKGANSSNSTCWDGYRKDGVKDSPSGTGETVNNCIKIGSPAKIKKSKTVKKSTPGYDPCRNRAKIGKCAPSKQKKEN